MGEHVFRLITAEFEPRELFNVVQFIMTDREGKGVMTLEEAMQVAILLAGHKWPIIF